MIVYMLFEIDKHASSSDPELVRAKVKYSICDLLSIIFPGFITKNGGAIDIEYKIRKIKIVNYFFNHLFGYQRLFHGV